MGCCSSKCSTGAGAWGREHSSAFSHLPTSALVLHHLEWNRWGLGPGFHSAATYAHTLEHTTLKLLYIFCISLLQLNNHHPYTDRHHVYVSVIYLCMAVVQLQAMAFSNLLLVFRMSSVTHFLPSILLLLYIFKGLEGCRYVPSWVGAGSLILENKSTIEVSRWLQHTVKEVCSFPAGCLMGTCSFKMKNKRCWRIAADLLSTLVSNVIAWCKRGRFVSLETGHTVTKESNLYVRPTRSAALQLNQKPLKCLICHYNMFFSR